MGLSLRHPIELHAASHNMPGPRRSDRIDGTVPAVNKPDSPTIVAESITVAKRPRGRPRKVPRPPEPATEVMTAASAAAGADAGHGGVAGMAERGDPAVIAFKRPRGRPRKVSSSAGPLPSRSSTTPASLQQAIEILPSPEPMAGSQPSPSLAITTIAIGEKAMADKPAISVSPTRSMIPDDVGRPDPVVPPRGRPGRPAKAHASSPLVVQPLGNSPFCPECGTYIRLFKPSRGRTRRVCPRCHPERMIEKRDPRFSLDKTGMPCKDRGKCRPERCVKALECGEMARKGTIRGAGNGSGG